MWTRTGRAAAALALSVFLALLASPAGAEVSVRATVDRRPAVQGEGFMLTVTVSGNAGARDEPELPASVHEAFDVSFAGTSRQMSFVNGQTDLSIEYRYVLVSRQTGTFTIPPISVRIGKDVYTTDAFDVRVEPRSSSTRAAPPTSGVRSQSGADLFVEARVDKANVVEGEEVVLTVSFYSPVRLLERQFTPPTLTGFSVETLPDVAPTTEVIDGVAYTVERARYALFPLSAGQKTIGAAQVRAVVPARRRDPFSVFGGFFDGRTLVVESDPVSINVSPLPPAADRTFSGAVGRFDLAASIDQDSLKQNDPLTLTVRVTGEGNLGTTGEFTASESTSFRVFDASSKTETQPTGDGLGGVREIQRVFVPLVSGRLMVPEVVFTYYDPDRDQYRTLRAGPFPITVAPSTDTGGDPVVVGKGEVRRLREDLRYIHTNAGELGAGGRSSSPFVWMLNAVPIVAVIGSVAWRRRRDRLAGDRRYVRARGAAKVARARLHKARAHGDRGYAELWAALGGYIADRLDASGSMLTSLEAERLLAAAGCPSDLSSRVRAFGERCDFARFAPGTPDQKATELTTTATGILDELERVPLGERA